MLDAFSVRTFPVVYVTRGFAPGFDVQPPLGWEDDKCTRPHHDPEGAHTSQTGEYPRGKGYT
jgi:hypothetical protein